MCETGSSIENWNVQETLGAGTKPVLYVPFCKCKLSGVNYSSSLITDGLSETEGGGGLFTTMHYHSPVEKL